MFYLRKAQDVYNFEHFARIEMAITLALELQRINCLRSLLRTQGEAAIYQNIFFWTFPFKMQKMPNSWVMWHRSSENDLIDKIDQLNLTSEGAGVPLFRS